MLFQTKKLSSLTPSGITIHQSCFALTINTMEDVNNFGKSDSVEEDEGNISELKTHDATSRGHRQKPLGLGGVVHTRVGGSLHDSTTLKSKIYQHYFKCACKMGSWGMFFT
jgi:hypothetical protein